jgi:group I intron endonuclease
MKTCGVYWIRNKVNNHIYIGHSVDLNNRLGVHRYELRHSTSHHRLLQDAVDKYGLKNFSFRILITCHPDMLEWYEQQFLDQWKPEYNIHPRADGGIGSKHSEEYKKKMSLAKMGSKHSEESKKKMSLAHKGHKLSEETKMNMRIGQRKRRELERNRI